MSLTNAEAIQDLEQIYNNLQLIKVETQRQREQLAQEELEERLIEQVELTNVLANNLNVVIKDLAETNDKIRQIKHERQLNIEGTEEPFENDYYDDDNDDAATELTQLFLANDISDFSMNTFTLENPPFTLELDASPRSDSYSSPISKRSLSEELSDELSEDLSEDLTDERSSSP